jgi:hypothetical protein
LGYGIFGGLNIFSSIFWVVFGVFLLLASFLPKLRGAFGTVLGLIFVLSIIGSLLGQFSNILDQDWWDDQQVEQRDEQEIEWDKERETQVIEDDELPESDEGSNEKKPITYFQHNHNWKENSGDNRKGKFIVRKDYFNESKAKRNMIQANPYNSSLFWNKVYKSLVIQDKGKLDEILKVYDEIGKKYNLNRNQFADMVVTSIQWIPYVLVLEKPCDESIYDGGFVTEYLMQGNPCLGGIKFGIQSPVEFMSNFKGDCDTRSVLCFLILDRFGYDAAVLVSEQYGHSIFGINLNIGGGDYIKHKGRRYYVWETTATGFKAGVIPPDCSNLRYWSVALNSN